MMGCSSSMYSKRSRFNKSFLFKDIKNGKILSAHVITDKGALPRFNNRFFYRDPLIAAI